ncbi:hypothetical protein AB8879_05350 [Alphaproteobacteria bacterium LSUCC0744]
MDYASPITLCLSMPTANPEIGFSDHFFQLIFGTSPLVRTRPRRVTLEQIGKAMYTLAKSYFLRAQAQPADR